MPLHEGASGDSVDTEADRQLLAGVAFPQHAQSAGQPRLTPGAPLDSSSSGHFESVMWLSPARVSPGSRFHSRFTRSGGSSAMTIR
jgi:hypothetical protein